MSFPLFGGLGSGTVFNGGSGVFTDDPGLPDIGTAAGILARLSISGVPINLEPGALVSGTLVGPLDPLQLASQITMQDVDLDLIAKDLVFSATNFNAPGFVEDPSVAKILPFFKYNLLSGTIPVVQPVEDPSGVPGLLGKLKGKIPVVSPGDLTALPQISGLKWTIKSSDGTELKMGDDFLAPDGVLGSVFNFIMAPLFSNYTTGAAGFAEFTVTASLSVTYAGATVSGDINLHIKVPKLPFPKLLALCMDKNFGGASLIVVPASSVITNLEMVKTLFDRLRTVLNLFHSIERFANMLIAIDAIAGIINSTYVAFSMQSRIDNLNDIDLIYRPWYSSLNDTEAEDELSSFIYLSVPPLGRTQNAVAMYTRRNCSTGPTVTANAGLGCFMWCRNLDSEHPAFFPHDGVAALTVSGPTANFNDSFSSLQFLG